jgi:hypothetical protein
MIATSLASFVGFSVLPDFQTFVVLIAQYAGPAILAFFLFYQERRVYADYKNSSAGTSLHDRRMHTATVVVTYVLIFACVGVWISNIFGKPRYIEGEFFGLTDQSEPKLTEQIAEELPGDAKFYMRQNGPEGGKTSYTVSWILVGDPGVAAIPFVFQYRYARSAHEMASGDDPGLNDEHIKAQKAQPSEQSLAVLTKRFSVDVKALRMSGALGVVLRYKPAPDLSTVGNFYLESEVGPEIPIPWDDEEPSRRGAVLPSLLKEIWTSPPSVYAQTSVDCAHSQLSLKESGELVDQLGSRDLTTQLAAQKTLVSCGTCCVPFLEEAVKDPSSSMNRERSILMASLAAVIRQDEANKVRLTDAVYARFGLTNFMAFQYKEASAYLNNLPPAFLQTSPPYYFYRGFARARTGDNLGAIADYQAYLNAAPTSPDRGKTYNNLAMVYYRMGKDAETAARASEAAEDYEMAMADFDQASQLGYSVTAVYVNDAKMRLSHLPTTAPTNRTVQAVLKSITVNEDGGTDKSWKFRIVINGVVAEIPAQGYDDKRKRLVVLSPPQSIDIKTAQTIEVTIEGTKFHHNGKSDVLATRGVRPPLPHSPPQHGDKFFVPLTAGSKGSFIFNFEIN